MPQTSILSIALIGSTGRLGQQILHQATLDQTLAIPIQIHTSNFNELDSVSTCDVVLDTSSPQILKELLLTCQKHLLPLVIGSTGQTHEQLDWIEKASRTIPILVAPNFSLGALILKTLCQKLSSLQSTCKVTIEETHHIHKKDAPSGTALWLGQDLITATIHSYRLDETPSMHEVIFEIDDEVLTLRHSARSKTPICNRRPSSSSLDRKAKTRFLYRPRPRSFAAFLM